MSGQGTRVSLILLLTLLGILSQTFLLAHAHDDETALAQVAACPVCVAVQHASPACAGPPAPPDSGAGHAPFAAEVLSGLESSFPPTAHPRGPPAPS